MYGKKRERHAAHSEGYTVNSESLFMQKLKDPELSFSRLFEAIQSGTLLQDAVTAEIPDTNLNERLAFSDPQEIPCRNWPIMSLVQEMTCVDRLFLLDFDIDSTEELEEISLEGIARLPVITNNQAQGIHSRENITNFLYILAELNRSRS
jgi:hypothetical protein